MIIDEDKLRVVVHIQRTHDTQHIYISPDVCLEEKKKKNF